MNKYANSKIYRIESDQTDLVYYGSTTQSLAQRMSNHRSNYKRYQAGKYNYVKSFDILKFDDAKIVWVEDYPCDSKEKLEARERHYIKTMDCVNKCQPGRTDKEYKQDNKVIIAQKNKAYKQANKATIKQKAHDYNVKRVTCGCGAEVAQKCLSRHKTRKPHIDAMAILN